MVKKIYTITNEGGIHAQLATKLVSASDKFVCSISLVRDGKKIDFKSIIGVLSLGINCNENIEIVFDGVDETSAADTVSRIFEEYRIGKEI